MTNVIAIIQFITIEIFDVLTRNYDDKISSVRIKVNLVH